MRSLKTALAEYKIDAEAATARKARVAQAAAAVAPVVEAEGWWKYI